MAARSTVKRARSAKKTAVAKKTVAAKTPVQEALEVTWLLKGNLKNVQIAYIRVGILLARVRDRRLYVALKHPDMEDYAEQRLNLGRASLYRYLQIHDWMAEFHPKWLEPKPEGFIPELTDVFDLIWIEKQLARRDLEPAMRATLEGMQKKAMEGRLREGELDPVRRRTHTAEEGLRAYLSKLRLLRKRGAELASLPPEVLRYLDTAIEILRNDHAAQAAGPDSPAPGARTGAKS